MENENLEFYTKGSETLLVSFGGMALKMGMSMFEFNSAISELDVDSLFLRDIKRIWYQNGISEKFNSVNLVTELLNSYTKKYRKVVFIGNSSGGFASIMFGIKLNVNTIISFSPQTCLIRQFGDNRWNPMLEELYSTYFQHNDLKPLLDLCDYNSSIIICVPKNNFEDMLHVNHIRNSRNIEVLEFETSEHNMAGYIKQTYGLSEFLKKYI